MIGLGKRNNAYARVVDGELGASKAVFAALAYSFAVQLAGEDGAIALMRAEWATLNDNGIVPQRPRSTRQRRRR